jgi:hypothetical protein
MLQILKEQCGIFEHVYANKFNNLDKIGQFLEYKLAKLNHE